MEDRVVQTCRRCRGEASHRFRRPEDATRLAGYLGSSEYAPLERLLGPLIRRLDRLQRTEGQTSSPSGRRPPVPSSG